MRSEWLCGPMIVQVRRATTPDFRKRASRPKNPARGHVDGQKVTDLPGRGGDNHGTDRAKDRDQPGQVIARMLQRAAHFEFISSGPGRAAFADPIGIAGLRNEAIIQFGINHPNLARDVFADRGANAFVPLRPENCRARRPASGLSFARQITQGSCVIRHGHRQGFFGIDMTSGFKARSCRPHNARMDWSGSGGCHRGRWLASRSSCEANSTAASRMGTELRQAAPPGGHRRRSVQTFVPSSNDRMYKSATNPVPMMPTLIMWV